MEGRKKKRQRKVSDSDENDDVNDDIKIDEAMENYTFKKDLNSSGDVEMDMNGMIYADFVFSGIRESYFHNIKTLVKPLFEFDNVNSSTLTDLILTLKEDVGTAIKNEDEDETKNPNVDIFGIFSMIPLTYYGNGDNTDIDKVAKQIFSTLKLKIEKYCNNQIDAESAINILKGSRVGLLISERVINLPQDGVPIALNFLINEIQECKDEDNYDNKFELDYVVIISKFVRRLFDDSKKTKKTKSDLMNDKNDKEEILHYKYETEHLLNKSAVNFSYKIPYDQYNLDYLENKNEPQYSNIMFIRFSDFVDVVNFLNENK